MIEFFWEKKFLFRGSKNHMKHQWEQVKNNAGYVLAFKCKLCDKCVGRWDKDPDDKPNDAWLYCSGIEQDCKENK